MKKRNELFSFWRLLFVVFIVGHHFAPAVPREAWWVFSTGQVCVTFFFVLSGFLAHQSSLREWKGGAAFLRTKFLSLAPLYFAVLMLSFAIDLASGVFRPGVFLADAALLQAWIPGVQLALNGPAWFMSALFACFAFYPLVRRLRRRALLLLAVLFWLGVQMACFALGANGKLEQFSYWIYFPIFHAPSFFLGVALAGLMASRNSSGRSSVFTLSASLLVLCALAFLPDAPQLVRQCAEISLFAPVFAALIWSVAGAPRRMVELADCSWLRYAGALAFPVYLLQMPVYKIFYQAVLKPLGGEMDWALFAGYLAVLFAGSWVWLQLLAPRCADILRRGLTRLDRRQASLCR